MELSNFQKKERKMQQQIKRLEEENLQPKPWLFSGETNANKRPLNSLLSADLEYEHATKLAPVITDEVTKNLEEIIKYRIIEQAFDDVIQKRFMNEKGDWRERGVELDSNKNNKSLAQVYEEEYQQKVGEIETPDHLSKAHKKVLRLFAKVCGKLDALSHLNLVPRNAKITKHKKLDMPAIRMEEITPITMSDASKLAPEEIFEKQAKFAQGETEKTKEDRKKDRKEKKEKKKKEKDVAEHMERQKAIASGITQKKEEDIKKGSVEKAVKQIKESGDRNVKFVSGTDTTNYSQSTALFNKLQEDAKKEARDYKSKQGARPTQNKQDTTANNFKL